MNIADLTYTSIETISAYTIKDANYLFTLDELQDATIEQTEDKQEVTGKGGRKLSNLKRNKAITISGTNGLVSGGLLEMQTGGTFETKTAKVMWTDYLTVESNAATSSYKAIGTKGDEIKELYVKNDDGTLGEEYSQGSAAASKVFTYAPDTKTFAFSGVADGTEIVAIYECEIADAAVLENEADTYSGKCRLYIDVLAEDKCSNVYHVQFYIPKADFSGEFSLEMGDNQTVHSFEAESLAGACGKNNTLWTVTIFKSNSTNE